MSTFHIAALAHAFAPRCVQADCHSSREEKCQKAHSWWILAVSVIVDVSCRKFPGSPMKLSHHRGLPEKDIKR